MCIFHFSLQLLNRGIFSIFLHMGKTSTLSNSISPFFMQYQYQNFSLILNKTKCQLFLILQNRPIFTKFGLLLNFHTYLSTYLYLNYSLFFILFLYNFPHMYFQNQEDFTYSIKLCHCNLKNQFYNMGTYCRAEIDSPNQIVFDSNTRLYMVCTEQQSTIYLMQMKTTVYLRRNGLKIH